MAPAGPHGGAVMTDRASAMRRTATAMLVLMAAIFAVSHWATGAYPQWATGLGYVNAFAEAAMVGGLADWFAVTALFRHPLGVPIPTPRSFRARRTGSPTPWRSSCAPTSSPHRSSRGVCGG